MMKAKEKGDVVMVTDLERELGEAISVCKPDRLFVLTDETTRELCLPVLAGVPFINGDLQSLPRVPFVYGDLQSPPRAHIITIPAGDTNKSLDSVCHVWSELQRLGATRHSLIVNLGGGMVTDLGGFAASTFKRGITYINIPTTLLSMVDASVGGKTGFNFGGLKNEIGVFSIPRCVLLDTTFLRTLDRENILSGYAEMLKHGLISDDETWAELLAFDIAAPSGCDLVALQQMLARSVRVKQRIVEEDPTEHGIRKALNLGHTIGHAFESLAMQRSPILHGYAVAYGLVCELYLSVMKTGFPVDKMRQTVSFIHEHYGRMPITCDDYPVLLELMTHDKKNTAGIINFTLLGGIGDIRIDQTATKDEITEALDFYREG
jgi:3-dehydroquinate synthase